MTILPQLERDLQKAAEERLGAEEVRRGRPRLGGLLVAFGVVVALAIAGVGIALVGGHRTTPTQSAAGTPPALHRLLSRYAVLRRPQTAADRAWRPVWEGHNAAPVQLLGRFTRLAGTLPGGQRIFLTVGRVVGPELGIKLGSYVLTAWVPSTDRTVVRQAGLYTAASVLAKANSIQTSSPFPMMYSARNTPGATLVSIIPDGVSTVGWMFPGHSTVIFVQGNIAAARLAAPTGGPERVYWYGRHGRIFKTYTHTQAPLEILNGNGVSGAKFGERRSKVEAVLTAQFGPASSPFRAGGGCGVDATVGWGELTAFFKHGRFIGYAYGSQSARPPSPPILATARGLRLGQTVAEARRLYGRAFQTSEAQGGDWLLTTAAGKLDGFLNTRSGRVGPHSTIASIQAGPSICAALSP